MLQEWWQQIAGGTGLAAVLGWLGSRVLRLEREKADRQSIADLVTEVKEQAKEARESRKALHAKMDATNASVAQIGERVARMEGRLNAP